MIKTENKVNVSEIYSDIERLRDAIFKDKWAQDPIPTYIKACCQTLEEELPQKDTID